MTHDPCLKKLDEAQHAFAMGWTAEGLRLLGEVKEMILARPSGEVTDATITNEPTD